MYQTITINRRFNGPPSSGNGGYVAGVLYEAAGGVGAWSVGLKAPPPLDAPLDLTRTGETLSLGAGSDVVAEVQPGQFEQSLPDLDGPLDIDRDTWMKEAIASFSGCFVCGRNRSLPDGLCIHAHPVRGREGMVAADWSLHEGLSDDGQRVAARYILSALDCPGYFACASGEPALLARITAEVEAELSPDGVATVVGWTLPGSSGRKRRCGTLILDQNGRRIARAEALWVVIPVAYLMQISGVPA